MADRLESKIQREIIDMLVLKGWYVINMPGNASISGFPDLFATHSQCGMRLIEVKRPMMKGSRFTSAQHDKFPKIIANGTPIFILTAGTATEYNKLFKPSNYWQYANGHFMN